MSLGGLKKLSNKYMFVLLSYYVPFVNFLKTPIATTSELVITVSILTHAITLVHFK